MSFKILLYLVHMMPESSDNDKLHQKRKVLTSIRKTIMKRIKKQKQEDNPDHHYKRKTIDFFG